MAKRNLSLLTLLSRCESESGTSDIVLLPLLEFFISEDGRLVGRRYLDETGLFCTPLLAITIPDCICRCFFLCSMSVLCFSSFCCLASISLATFDGSKNIYFVTDVELTSSKPHSVCKRGQLFVSKPTVRLTVTPCRLSPPRTSTLNCGELCACATTY